MADEYIKRSEIHDLVNNDTSFGLYKEDDSGCDVAFSISEVHKMIDKIPSADVQPVVHGEWIEKETFHDENADVISEWQSARCSVCNKYHTTPYLYCFTDYNFCPNCGADMRSNAKLMPSKEGGT